MSPFVLEIKFISDMIIVVLIKWRYRVKKFLRKILYSIVLVISLCVAVAIYQGHKLYEKCLDEEPLKEKIDAIIAEKQNYVKYDEINEDYINAVISVEDVRFFDHKGVDIISICRALVVDIKNMNFTEGGSTITQQLAKNIYFNQKKEITRKIAEIFMAKDIENNYSKKEIFELYVNTIYYGDGYYSLYDASKGYFGKEPKEMNLYEETLLAGIPNAPSVYSPTVNPELSKQRQKQVIYKMLKNDFITEEIADNLCKQIDQK